MDKAIRNLRHTAAGLAVVAIATAGATQAVTPKPAASFAPDERTGVLADYTLNHHGTAHWPRHTRIELGRMVQP